MAEVCGGPTSRSQLPSYSTHFPFLILTCVRGVLRLPLVPYVH